MPFKKILPLLLCIAFAASALLPSCQKQEETPTTAISTSTTIEGVTPITTTTPNSAAPAAVDYTWRNVKLGALGYVTGMVINPADPDVRYIRTDVGGAYRWDKDSDSWLPLMDGFGPDKANFYGVDGIATDPQQPNVVYAAVGQYWYWGYGGNSDVLKSTDYGATWTDTNIGLIFNSNDASASGQRMDGECLAVDPHDSDVIYCGARAVDDMGGLYVSYDGAATWQQIPISSVPAGTAYMGIRTVLFDPNSGTDGGGRTKTIYAGVYGGGVYASYDAGQTWGLLQNGPLEPKRMAVGPDGSLYVTSGAFNAMDDATGVYKYSSSSKNWTDITPRPDKLQRAWGGLSVDGNGVIIVTGQGGGDGTGSPQPVCRSMDGGATWTTIVNGGRLPNPKPEIDDSYILGTVDWEFFSNNPSTVVSNPAAPNQVFMCDGFTVWTTDDITASPVKWHTCSAGIEELCVQSVVSPPSGFNVLAAIMDLNGVSVDLGGDYPTQTWNDTSNGNWNSDSISVDFCRGDPRLVARTGMGPLGDYGKSMVYMSSDGGQSWRASPSWKYSGSVIHVAVSSAAQGGAPVSMIVEPEGHAPVYSTDFGFTWHDCAGLGFVADQNRWAYNLRNLAADQGDGSVFYYYNYETGSFYTSRDGGATFSLSSNVPNSDAPSIMTIQGKPGTAGEVWMSLGDDGLYRSTDYGATFTQVPGVGQARSFAFGVGSSPAGELQAPGSNTPSIFVQGTISGVSGIFISDDNAATWRLISNGAGAIGDVPGLIAADGQVYGRVYVPTSGRGLIVGEAGG